MLSDDQAAEVAPPSAERVLAILRENKGEIMERSGVASLAVSGSYARGEQREGSDLDLLVDSRCTPTFIELADLEDYLAALLGVGMDVGTRGGSGSASQNASSRKRSRSEPRETPHRLPGRYG